MNEWRMIGYQARVRNKNATGRMLARLSHLTFVTHQYKIYGYILIEICVTIHELHTKPNLCKYMTLYACG